MNIRSSSKFKVCKKKEFWKPFSPEIPNSYTSIVNLMSFVNYYPKQSACLVFYIDIWRISKKNVLFLCLKKASDKTWKKDLVKCTCGQFFFSTNFTNKITLELVFGARTLQPMSINQPIEITNFQIEFGVSFDETNPTKFFTHVPF